MFKTNENGGACDYFSSINSMARRIMVDSEYFQSKVDQNQWSKMSYEDRCETIMKEFITPVVLEKYPSSGNIDVDVFPKLNILSGNKYVVDGEGKSSEFSWRDEHSGPFSWETQSQYNLSWYLEDKETDAGIEKKSNRKAKKSAEVPKLSVPPSVSVPSPDDVESEDNHDGGNVNVVNTTEIKRDASSSENFETPLESPTDEFGIPKTGFDFLDNW